jgi:cytochrome P450
MTRAAKDQPRHTGKTLLALTALGVIGYLLATRRKPGLISVGDTLKIGLGVGLPTLAMGPIIRRRGVMKVAETMDFISQAVKTLQGMREKHGAGPIMMNIFGRKQAVLLNYDDVRRVLDETPEPFATVSSEKFAALAHFEPQNVLISHGPDRAARRRLNEETLEHDQPLHSLSERLLRVTEEEIRPLLQRSAELGHLDWDSFYDAWFRMVRRVIFGDSARDDTRLTTLMQNLRAEANWAILKPVETKQRDELHTIIRFYLNKQEPGTLVSLMAAQTPSDVSSPEQQIPQWLFAFDPSAMATFRALALLAVYPEQLQRVRSETISSLTAQKAHRPLARASVCESLRLWPTTPMILRQTTRETSWDNRVMPAGTGILIYTPFFHRDETRIPFAHTFQPDVWIQDDPEVKGNPPRSWPFVPFSGGSGICPGRNLMLMLSSAVLSMIVAEYDVRLEDTERLSPQRLPGTLNHYTLRFALKRGSEEAAGTYVI